MVSSSLDHTCSCLSVRHDGILYDDGSPRPIRLLDIKWVIGLAHKTCPCLPVAYHIEWLFTFWLGRLTVCMEISNPGNIHVFLDNASAFLTAYDTVTHTLAWHNLQWNKQQWHYSTPNTNPDAQLCSMGGLQRLSTRNQFLIQPILVVATYVKRVCNLSINQIKS